MKRNSLIISYVYMLAYIWIFRKYIYFLESIHFYYLFRKCTGCVLTDPFKKSVKLSSKFGYGLLVTVYIQCLITPFQNNKMNVLKHIIFETRTTYHTSHIKLHKLYKGGLLFLVSWLVCLLNIE